MGSRIRNSNFGQSLLCIAVKEVCSDPTLDVFFLIDGSTSIGRDNFAMVTQFLAGIVQHVPESSRVGAIQYSGSVRTEFSLDGKQTTAQVQGTNVTKHTLLERLV